MCKINLRLIIALLTFGIGVFTVYKFFLETEKTAEKVQTGEEISKIHNDSLSTKNIDSVKSQEEVNDEEIISNSFVKCSGQNFNLVLISKYNLPNPESARSLNIAVDKTIIKTINSPDYVFMDAVEKTREGFEISVEYGSRYKYKKQFNFICKQGKFYLTKTKTTYFDGANPETTWKVYSKVIKPNLQLEKFLIDDFMED